MNTTKQIDRLTARYTAFNTFAEFCKQMATGYVPTIYPNHRRGGRKVIGKVKLTEAVRAAGFKVYDGVKVS